MEIQYLIESTFCRPEMLSGEGTIVCKNGDFHRGTFKFNHLMAKENSPLTMAIFMKENFIKICADLVERSFIKKVAILMKVGLTKRGYSKLRDFRGTSAPLNSNVFLKHL